MISTASDQPGNPADPESAVFGPERFVGRAGLVRNLMDRCERRQSVLVYGGPKLGKTSLLLHLQWLMTRRASSEKSPSARYLDLADDELREGLLAGRWDRSAVLLLDNCDQLVGQTSSLGTCLRAASGNGSSVKSIVWAGGRAWRDFVRSGSHGLLSHPDPVVPAPLAILLEKEAQTLVQPNLTASQHAAVLAHGGTHPYILKVLRSQVIARGRGADLSGAIRAAGARLAPFFQACMEGLREPVERSLLSYLVASGEPVNPREAARALDLPTIKPVADTLCYLGLISRWNLAEGARLRANCRLFNDWYLAYTDQQT